MILPWLILIPFIGGLLCWLGERFGSTLPRWIALLTMSLELALGLWLWSQGNYSFAPAPGADPTWALEFQHTWIARFGISVHLALDGLSLLMILLTGLLGRASAFRPQLAAALRGDVAKGLFFRGAGELPFGAQIRSVRELIERLLTPAAPQPA